VSFTGAEIGLVWCGESNGREKTRCKCFDKQNVKRRGRQRGKGDKIREGGNEKGGQGKGITSSPVGLGK